MLELLLAEELGDVFAQPVVGERAIDVGSVRVPLKLGQVDDVALGERREHLGEVVGRAGASVEEQQRWAALTVLLEVHLHAALQLDV
ncbi:MAG: hypothetical protein QM723_06705 [Myxococcaceae bacterium]